MPRTPTKAAIVAEERGLLQRQRVFRFVADRVTAVLARCRSVEAISLFGSVARPLRREVPRFAPYKQLRLPIAHECSATIWMMRVLPHPEMLPNGPSIASPECSRHGVILSIGKAV
jgi:hypothetical protein